MIRRLLLAALLVVAALVTALWIEHRSEVTLPAPTGPFAVGRAVFDWVADAPAASRELLVWIWYPAAPRPGASFDEYVPASLRAPAPRRTGILTLLTRDSSKVHSHSLRNAALSPLERSYPVVIFRAGASAPVVNYSTLTEDLASHGYVVVGFDAPYRTSRVVFPDGRVIEENPQNNPELYSGNELTRVANRLLWAWSADVALALDRLAGLNAADPSGRFTGRLDMARVGVFGHSFGGATALQFCHDDARCKAGIDIDGAPIDGVIQTGVQKPFMFLLSDHSRESDREAPRIMANIRSIYDRLPADGRAYVVIRGANHFTFSDDGALLKSSALRALFRVLGKLAIDGRRQLAITAESVHSFFDTYLK
jgi:predicted dienelactone hydrolase